MKTTALRSLGALALIACSAVLALPVQAQTTIDQLGWLAGCWRADKAETGSEEHWLAPAGGTMLGVGRTVRNGATVAHEFMQIRQRPDGALVFIALPSGNTSETVFTLKPGSATELVFENATHDFPQRVIYRRGEGARLNARIEGQRNGQARGIDFPMARVACERP